MEVEIFFIINLICLRDKLRVVSREKFYLLKSIFVFMFF